MSKDKKDLTGVKPNLTPVYYLKLHEVACQERKDTYFDPMLGLDVFTSLYLQKRGYCCKSKCRHCPYGYREEENV